MQKQSRVHFFNNHNSSVRAVSFNPKDRYVFASGSCDGYVNLFSALKKELIVTYNIVTASLSKVVNGIRFNSDGTQILVSTTAKRLAVIDIVKGEQVQEYDNCTFNGRDRSAIAIDSSNPSIVVTTNPNGRGITIIDLRMPLASETISELHNTPIRDVQFFDQSWPFSRASHFTIATASNDGSFKVVSLDGKILHNCQVGHSLNTIALTPEPFQAYPNENYSSLITCGGNHISSYTSTYLLNDQNSHSFFECDTIRENGISPIWKIRYNSSGGICFSADDSGIIRKYRRINNRLQYLGVVYQHKGDIQDIDISPYDEYLISGSKDKTVGLITIGSPNHGTSEYYEYT